LFPLDLWSGEILENSMPQLFSYAKNKNISLQQACQAQPFQDLFHLPMSVKGYQQFQALKLEIQALQLVQEPDSWIYIWNTNIFSSKKAYAHLSGRQQTHRAYTWLWKACSQNSRKVFF
jgi:hypothetical protein